MTIRTLLTALAIALPAVGATSPLAATPTSLTFTWIEGSTLPVAQITSISAGSSLVAYTTSTASTPWITITPATGTLPSALSVLVNPSGLSVGTYAAAIQVVATPLTTIFIPVTLVIEAPLPTLVLSTSTLSFSTPPAMPAAQTVTLTSTGGQPVTFNASVASTAWLTVAPTSGVVLPGLPITLSVTVNNAGFAPNITPYSGKISIVATGVVSTNITQTIAVGMLVNALLPTVTQLYPSAVLVGSPNLTVTLTGTGFYKGGTTASASALPLATTYVNPTTLTVIIPSTLLAAAGTINVSAVNPLPGGGVSVPSVFIVSQTPVVEALVSAASYATGAVSPGEFVTLFGTGIGPVAPAGMSVIAGYATFSLGGVSVTVDGLPAAMIYVSANQLTVQVPYGASIGSSRLVAVTNNGVSESYAPGVTVQATAPGLFLVSGVVGQCAALRYSSGAFSVNSSTNLALAGDTIVFYLTGEGNYDPALLATSGYVVPPTLAALTAQTGQIAWPLVSPLPTVTIGGVAATVSYAGPVPGGLLGLLQINAIVPLGSTKGTSVPVSITIGTATTQAGATVALK